MQINKQSKACSAALLTLAKQLGITAVPFLNLEKAMLLALASFLLPCHLRWSEGTAEILENDSNASGTVMKSESFQTCSLQGEKV